ncbi:MAG: hypothetical protein WKF63_09025 [Thermomicrobiales bacterium]
MSSEVDGYVLEVDLAASSLVRVWLLFGAARAAEGFEDNAEVAGGREVGDVDTVERSAEGKRVSWLERLRHHGE